MFHITFFDTYAELASQGDAEQIVEVANKLKAVGLKDQSLWKRFGATKAINALHGTLAERKGAGGEDVQQFTDADSQLLAIIEEIKAAEKDPQLQQVYTQLPQP